MLEKQQKIFVQGKHPATVTNYLNQNTLGVKKERPRTKKKKKGLDKKEVKSKWAAKACVVLLLMEIKILIITIQAAKH